MNAASCRLWRHPRRLQLGAAVVYERTAEKGTCKLQESPRGRAGPRAPGARPGAALSSGWFRQGAYIPPATTLPSPWTGQRAGDQPPALLARSCVQCPYTRT